MMMKTLGRHRYFAHSVVAFKYPCEYFVSHSVYVRITGFYISTDLACKVDWGIRCLLLETENEDGVWKWSSRM